MGKGDKRRSIQVNRKEFDDRWDKAFGKKVEYKIITIALSGNNWVDLTNNCFIGNTEELIEYINSKGITVINEEVFLYKDKFWYNCQ